MIGGQTNQVEDTNAAGRTPLSPSAIQQHPAPFDGILAWDAYHAQFELLVEMNRQNSSEKATHLATSLKGAAATVLTNLPPEKYHDYICSPDYSIGLPIRSDIPDRTEQDAPQVQDPSQS